jgi:membrane protease YdiL (CAAX protease family)
LSSPHNPQREPQQPPTSATPQVPEPSGSDPFAIAAAPPTSLAPTASKPPVENPVWNGWDLLAIVGLTVLAMLVLQALVIYGALFISFPRSTFGDVAQNAMVILFSQFLIYVAAAIFMVMLVEGKYHVPFWQAIRWNWPRSGWRLLALGAGLLLVLGTLQNFFPMPKDSPFERLFQRPRDAYLLSLMAVTLGPLMEEVFFRGLMYPVLARRMGVAWGIVLTALPFGLIHLPQYGWAWGAGLVIFLVGVACGIVRAATKSVGASFLLHVGYNGAQMLIAIVATHGFRDVPKACAVLLIN